jgi:hypothetical protein
MIYVGIDLHRKRSQIAALDEQGTELLSRRVTAGRAVASPLRAPRAARTGLSFVKTRVRLTAVATMPANGRTAGTSPGHVAEEEGQLQGPVTGRLPQNHPSGHPEAPGTLGSDHPWRSGRASRRYRQAAAATLLPTPATASTRQRRVRRA